MADNDTIEQREVRGFQIIYAPLPEQVVTQAFILCDECNGVVSSTMGPRKNALCIACTKALVAADTIESLMAALRAARSIVAIQVKERARLSDALVLKQIDAALADGEGAK